MDDVTCISPEIDADMVSSRIYTNDILYNITGASIGRSALYTLEEQANVNQHVCIIRLKQDSPKFISYFLLSRLGAKELFAFQAGGNREGLNYQQLGSFKLSLPALPEQKRIVAVLDAWDSYLEKLARKIEIKKQIKKGLMQKLLSGKKRLRGFAEPWAPVKLADVCKVTMGQSPPSSSYNVSQSGRPLIQGNADLKNRKTIQRIWTSEPSKFAEKNQIIMTVRAPVGSIGIAQEDVCIGRGVCAIAAKDADHNYILHYLIGLEKKWMSFEQGSTFTAVNGSDIRGLKLYLPKTKQEQTAIADILTKAGDEIEVLEKKKQIIEEQKKFLLNNLITGQIRTPQDLLERLPHFARNNGNR